MRSQVRVLLSPPCGFVSRKIEDLCNGSTPDSDSVCGGSNPSSSAKNKGHPFGWPLSLAEDENGFERAASVVLRAALPKEENRGMTRALFCDKIDA